MTAAASGSWREADRLDRARYAQASRTCGEKQEPATYTSSGGTEIEGSSAERQPADSHYALLGIERSASAADIRRAYRRELVTAHPDKGGPRERFEQLQAAFAVLSDPTERLIYDERLDRELGASGAGCGSSGATAAAAGGAARVRRDTAGVTAVVHGQTQGSAEQPLQPLQPPQCRQQVTACDSQLAAATAAIQELQAGAGQPGSAAAATLAAAYLSRAELRCAAGQLHHALFDAEEALRLQPGLERTAELRGKLAAEVEAADACGTGGQDAHSNGSSSSDDDF
ncbi:hypothetical protein ABPG75_006952 [Micractinium tetrahymenae]